MPYWGGWGPCCCEAGTPITGTMRGCGSFGVAGTVTVKSTDNATTYGTISVPASGSFSGAVAIPSSGLYNIHYVISPSDAYAARFVDTVTQRTLTINVTNNLGIVALTAATGYSCANLVYFPLANTLHVTDSYDNKTVSIVHQAGTQQWPGILVATPYLGCVTYSCAAVPGAFKRWTFDGAGNAIGTAYTAITAAALCPSTGPSTHIDSLGTASLSVTSESPFMATGTLAGGNTSRWYCGNSTTFTLTE